MVLSFAKARAAHIRLGSAGEAAASRMFRNAGCEVLIRDCRLYNGELDLVVRDGLTVVFVEVKSRRVKSVEQAKITLPGINLRSKQRRRIYRAALTYLREIGKPEIPIRFDLVELVYVRNILYSVRHSKSAFGQRKENHSDRRINLFR